MHRCCLVSVHRYNTALSGSVFVFLFSPPFFRCSEKSRPTDFFSRFAPYGIHLPPPRLVALLQGHRDASRVDDRVLHERAVRVALCHRDGLHGRYNKWSGRSATKGGGNPQRCFSAGVCFKHGHPGGQGGFLSKLLHILCTVCFQLCYG